MTQANEFIKTHGTDALAVMTALDAAKIPANQDWENEKTTWTFSDGSTIVISGSQITAQSKGTR